MNSFNSSWEPRVWSFKTLPSSFQNELNEFIYIEFIFIYYSPMVTPSAPYDVTKLLLG